VGWSNVVGRSPDRSTGSTEGLPNEDDGRPSDRGQETRPQRTETRPHRRQASRSFRLSGPGELIFSGKWCGTIGHRLVIVSSRLRTMLATVVHAARSTLSSASSCFESPTLNNFVAASRSCENADFCAP
jgi:hypothetical protein